MAHTSWFDALWFGCAAAAFAGWLLPPAPARAAPFCVQTQAVPPQCIYFDASSCTKRAKQLGGTCTANEDEVKVSGGIGHFCVVTSGQVAQCLYLSRDDCDRQAHQQQAVCVQSQVTPESPAPDPFRDTRPLMAGH